MLDGWDEFAGALVLFFLSHGISSLPGLRRTLRASLGARIYGVLYGTLSLLLFYWLILAAGRAPFIPLWDPAPWHFLAPHIAMPIACLLLTCGLGTPNPFSLGGTAGSFSPIAPGIVGVTRHPVLWAATLWATAHIFPNGDVAHVLLFAPLGFYGIIGTIVFDARRRAAWGPAHWHTLAARTSWFPGWAWTTGKWRGDPKKWPWRRVMAAITLYIVILGSHAVVIGVSPWPF